MKNQRFDIAIIGGGVIGLTLARVLRGDGADVAVIDAGSAIPAATHAAAGMLAPSFEHAGVGNALDKALYDLGARGLALWPGYASALEEETGVFIDYRGAGALGLAYDEAGAEALSEKARQVTVLGGAAEMISGDEARAMEPALSNAVVAALHAPADAQVDPRRLTAALLASLKTRDAALISGRVVRVSMKDAGAIIDLESGETVSAGKVVLASGAVSGLVPEALVHPVKGAALAVASSAFTRIVRAPGAYLCPKAGGRLVIGATEERGRQDLDVDDASVAGLCVNAARAAPDLAAAGEIERWAGLRPGTPDGAPILGRDGEGRFLALGHYRNGVLHAPAAAEAMAALVLGRPLAFDIASFGIERFTAGQAG